MNFTTLQSLFVEPLLRILGRHEVPGFEYSDLPAFANRDVFNRLGIIPGLVTHIKGLHANQEAMRPTNNVDRKLKIVSRSAGLRLVRASTVLEELRAQLSLSDPDAPFTQYESLANSAVEIKWSLNFWEESIDAKEFWGRYKISQNVRFRYVLATLHLLFVIVDLIFPDDFRDYSEELGDVISRPWLQEQFLFDSPETYAWSKSRVTLGITVPDDRYLKRFIPYGLTELTPFWIRNRSLYGHYLVANELCIRKRKGALHGGVMNPSLRHRPKQLWPD